MEEKRILVVGELNVDMIVSGLPTLPELGREMIASDLRVVLGGSSAICAAGLARLGAEVNFLGKVGEDDYGDFIVEELRLLDVGVDHVIRDGSIRTGMTISLTYPDDRALVTYLGCIAALRREDIDLSILSHHEHLHVGSYFLQKGLQPGLPELFRQAREENVTVSLDTGYDPYETWGGQELLSLLDLVDIFLPNEEEAQAIARTRGAESALQKLARSAGLVVVKRGASGALAEQGDRLVHSPAFEVDTVDTTGAGDSFNAGFIFAYVGQGESLRDSLRFGNACGALSTTGFGGTAAQPALDQVLTFLKTRSG